jgi:type IV pilus assembly protein PilA
MSEKSDLLYQIRPLADPLRIFAILLVVVAAVEAIVGLATGAVLSALGAACFSSGLALLIAPWGKPNAIYLRAFRTDKSTAELRGEIAAILGPDFRLSGIRAPRERTWVFLRFLLPLYFAFRYAGSKFMELEAGDDWLARLWKTYQTTRLVLIDVRDLTPYVQQEVRLTLHTVGTSRSVFVVNQEKTESEWRQLLAQIIGPESDSAQLQLLDVSPPRVTSRQMESDLKDIVSRLPADLPGEREPGRQFILGSESEELVKAKKSAPSLLLTVVAAVTSQLLWVGFVVLLNSMAEAAVGPALIFAVVAVGFLLVLVIKGTFRGAARARRLERAGHGQASARAWSILLLDVVLLLAAPALTAVQPIKQLLVARKRANEASVVASLRTLNTAEFTYSSTYPDIGFTCQLSALDGKDDSGAPTPEAAQLISADLASGNKAGYTLVFSDCKRAMVSGRNVNIGYRITAAPNIPGETGDRGFCTDEKAEVFYDPNGGTNCTEPLQSGGTSSTYVVPESPAVQESRSLSQDERRKSAIAEAESRMGDRLAAPPGVHRYGGDAELVRLSSVIAGGKQRTFRRVRPHPLAR